MTSNSEGKPIPHPETTAYFQARAADNVKPYNELSVEEARKVSLVASQKYAGVTEFDGTEEEIIVPSKDCKGMFCVFVCTCVFELFPFLFSSLNYYVTYNFVCYM